MLSGYQKLGTLVLSSVLLVIVAEAYNDVDLRIAERKAIPHYIRHSVEYPDIDIKKIMQQRGIQLKPYDPSTINRGAHHHQGSNAVDNSNRVWGSHHHQGSNAADNNNNRFWGSHHGKTNAMSNHLEPRPSRYFWKKSQRDSKYFKSPHHTSKAKVKSRYSMYHK